MKHFGKKVEVDGYKIDSEKEANFYLRFIKTCGKRYEVHKSFEQRKLIAQLERDMKELGITVDYSEMAAHHCIVFEVEGYNRIIIWLSNDCFLSLNLSNNPQFAKVAPKVLYIANKFMDNYRKIDMEAKA